MQSINVTLSVAEIKALLQMAQNQLFRLKFLDPKMPGYKARPGEVEAAESAVKALERALATQRQNGKSWSMPVKRVAHHGGN